MSNSETSQSQPIVVQKYGGSSVADSEHLRRVAARIVATRESGKKVVVVVSAMAKATDDLLCRAQEVADSPSRRELDMLLSCGERASMALLAMAVHQLGHKAVSLTGSQSGIMTNGRHSGAKIIEVRPVRVVDELERGHIVIVAGFQGVSYKREITTLGRGGSDTTAVALAAALGAQYCEICSDVKGVYTADPRLVPAAQLLEALGTDEMLELAAHGAKVLHSECVEIALRSDVKLYACSTSQAGQGTRIERIPSIIRTEPVGITGLKNLVCLKASSTQSLLKLAHKFALSAIYFHAEGESAQLWLSLDDVPDWSACNAVFLAQGILVQEGLGMVSIVGKGVGAEIGTLLTVQEVLSQDKFRQCRYQSSPIRTSVFCTECEVDELIEVFHQILISSS